MANALEKSLLLLQSSLSFVNIFRKMMGFPEYGHFVLMLMQVHTIRFDGMMICLCLHGYYAFVCVRVCNSGMVVMFSVFP
jgi:hypothetical protein